MSLPETINAKEFAKLSPVKLRPTYHTDGSMGSGCYGDPPGFPSYYIQSVYTQHGNSPRKGAESVIFGRVLSHSKDWDTCKDWDQVYAKRQARMLKLWAPLPLDHVRTRAWMAATFAQHRTCYVAPEAQAAGKWDTVIFPVPDYKLRSFHDDPRFSDEWREAEKAKITIENRDIIEVTSKIATIDNHSAVLIIRRYYPDWTPTKDEAAALLAGKVPAGYANDTGQWWETESERPTPETCRPRSMGQHPINITWCQFCGWDSRADAKGEPWNADEAKQHKTSAERTFRHDDPDTCRRHKEECGACVLSGYLSPSAKADGQTEADGPNYAGWARLYVEAGREIPKKWRAAFEADRNSSNKAYAGCLERSIATFGVKFAKY